jgi:hypothetical protein
MILLDCEEQIAVFIVVVVAIGRLLGTYRTSLFRIIIIIIIVDIVFCIT